MAFWAMLALLLVVIFQTVRGGHTREETVIYTDFLQQVEAGNIKSLEIVEQEVHGELHSDALVVAQGVQRSYTNFRTDIPLQAEGLMTRIRENNPGVRIKVGVRGMNWTQVLFGWFPILLILGIWIFIMRQMQSGGNRAFTFGKSKAKMLAGGDRPDVSFKDVAGADEAKEELEEIIGFLRNPARFQKLGGKIPKGALLVGSPGTGKTLLAKAVAGEADVPFFSMSGSDFVEMFVGVGASRVRDLFEQGRKHAPCIIFIDEMDAVGRQRGAGLGGGHDEREQTLNQLLVEMDGFDSSDGVILIAATNRPDVLDPALLRPGRFDRQIVVDLPDLNGREGILRVHAKPIPLDDEVDLMRVARGTPGFSGADLANVMNEAALLAARRNQDTVTMQDLVDAKDKVAMGSERKSLIISEEEKAVVACHEAGHTLVAMKLEDADPVSKVTIIPRGQSLGTTFQLPIDEKHNLSRKYCLNKLAVIMGGRVAEEIVHNEITNGAKGDIDQATNLVRRMVCEWGMSDALGPIAFGRPEEQVFLGREIVQNRHTSEETSELIDKEVHRMVDEGRARAHEILTEHRASLDALTVALLERETLDEAEIRLILEGRDLPPIVEKQPADPPPDDAEPTATEDRSPRAAPDGASPTPPVGEAPAG
ncbi:MAG: ATP-dependent zinc metalloprotease FtsH [Gemmatimonadota bacterium]|jgi:cell division protease FtsH|nr:cell division protein FtsH [Gemmatimonadota bacterium]MDP6460256.1 ATP-dependent zinc metalloprotease FtsH [Gemmatimonadota bacterium]MDP6530118.1 ATP-dependent zinc metalloprotease FtsH [Gemmatimonadota bacterium]MDP6801954.1 ATP-dependent zinc metalloprotease FtsH [Gemmatimonadota bacterium]